MLNKVIRRQQIPGTLIRITLFTISFLLLILQRVSADRIIKAGQFSGMEITLILGAVVEAAIIVVLFTMIVLLFVKYPLRTFIRAKALGISPQPNRRMKIVSLDEDNEMAKVKGGGYVFTKTDHFFIESKSKKPIALVDSRVGKTISIDAYKLMSLLKEAGYHSFDDMLAALEANKNAEITTGDVQVEITKDMLKKYGKDLDDHEGVEVSVEGFNIKLNKDIIKEIKKHAKATVNVAGETIPLSDAVDFFSESIPGDVIEAKIQYRTAVENVKQRRKDLVMWIVVVGFFIICVGFAVLLISHAAPPLANIAENVAADTGSRVVGTGLS